MDCPDNIHCIQKILDETIRERNEICQMNEYIRKRDEQLKHHLDNLFYKCKCENAELVRQEDENNKLVRENLKLEQVLNSLRSLITSKKEDLENIESAENEYDKLVQLNKNQRSIMEEMKRENEKLREAIKTREYEKQKEREQLPHKLEAMRREILALRETEKRLRKEICLLEHDRIKINKYYNEAKQDFERTCDKLAYQENVLLRYKGTMDGLVGQQQEIDGIKQKLTNPEKSKIQTYDVSKMSPSKESKRRSAEESEATSREAISRDTTPRTRDRGKHSTSPGRSKTPPKVTEHTRKDSIQRTEPMMRSNAVLRSNPIVTARKVHFEDGKSVTVHRSSSVLRTPSCDGRRSGPDSKTSSTLSRRSPPRLRHVSVSTEPTPVLSILKNSDKMPETITEGDKAKSVTSESRHPEKAKFWKKRKIKRRQCCVQ